jgi:hypothetical protein
MRGSEMQFTVDYDMSIAELLNLGDYNRHIPRHSNELISTNFAVAGKGKRELLAQILDNVYLQVATLKANSLGAELRYANIQELLAFGAAYPTCQLYCRIVCLGTTVDRTERMGRTTYFHGAPLPQPETVKKLVPCLDVENSTRTARLMPLDSLRYTPREAVNYLVITDQLIHVA